VKRVISVGPGASGKSTLAARLGEITGLPVIEPGKLFWRPGLAPAPHDEQVAIQRQLVAHESWITDGDPGPRDLIDVRLRAADAVVFPDFSPLRCVWRAIRRSPERAGFRRWLLAYRRRSRPPLRQAIAAHVGDADIHVLATPRAVRRFVARIASGTQVRLDGLEDTDRALKSSSPGKSCGSRHERVSAEAACEILHKALPRKRHGRGYQAAAARGARFAA
jgi:hypothetical protein